MNRFCGTCGAERAAAHQRFCGSCGAPLETAPAAAAAGTAGPAWSGGPDRLDLADGTGPGRVPRRRPWGPVVGAVAVVLALAAAGLVGWQLLAPEGGADSPEEAVRELLTSAAAQDPVGALGMVNPGEVEGVDDLYRSANARAQREGLVGKDKITDALDVRLEGLEFDVDELGDAAARVVLTGGDYTVTFDPDRLPDRLAFVADAYPEGKEWRGDILRDLGSDLPDVNPENDRPEPYLDVVRVDGRWYVSLVGTYLDLMFDAPTSADLEEFGVRAPDYDALDEEPDPIVAAEPEGVLDNLAEAVDAQDADELLANFPAEQVNALRPWARTVEDLVGSGLTDLDAAVGAVDVDVEEAGDLVRMTVDRATVEGAYVDEDGDQGAMQAEVDGRCVRATDEYGNEDDACLEGMALDLGVEEFYLMLRKVDGGYQVDPLATAVSYARDIVDRAPASLVDRALEEICSSVEGEGC